jgi:type VI secretion system secreted protein VgrG
MRGNSTGAARSIVTAGKVARRRAALVSREGRVLASAAVGRSAALLGNRASFTLTVEGCEELRVVRFSGHEGVSTPYEFRLVVAAGTMPLEALVGQPTRLTIEGLDSARRVHGLICEAGYVGEGSGRTLYELTLVPEVWRLGQRFDCRVFQQRTTPEVVAEVFKLAGLAAAGHRFELTGSYAPHDYCVQYRESDLDFVARLLEDAGIHYYFEHEDDRHVLVLTDDGVGGRSIAGDPVLRFAAEDEVERVSRFELRDGMRPQRVTLRDVNLRAPATPVEASEGAGGEREVYDYPGGFQRAGKGGPEQAGLQARLRLAALQAGRRAGAGASDSPRLTPGYLFTLADARREHLEGEYRVTRVLHRGEQPQALDESTAEGFEYANEFECVDRRIAYHTPRVTRRPVVRGAQTATVVGPGGEEVHCDDQGRVKVAFHWDRGASHDERSSCWVRVSQAWAGNGFGAVFLPRIGHEVIVDFLEGDPNRPIVTGRIYTGFNTPPYPLPDEKTKSTIRSESTPGGGGYNELRFEDAKGREEVLIHAQRDWTIAVLHDKGEQIGRDEARAVGRDRSEQVGHDRRESVGHDRSITVGNDHAEAIGANMSVTVGGGLSEAVGGDASRSVGGSLSESIAVAKSEAVALASALSIGAAYQISVGGAMNESVGLAKAEQVGLYKSVAVGGDSSESIAGGKSVQAGANISASAGQNVALSAGKHVNVSAGQNVNVAAGKSAGIVVADKLTIQCGDATVTLKKNGDVSIAAKKLSVRASGEVSIKGSKVKLN